MKKCGSSKKASKSKALEQRKLQRAKVEVVRGGVRGAVKFEGAEAPKASLSKML